MKTSLNRYSFRNENTFSESRAIRSAISDKGKPETLYMGKSRKTILNNSWCKRGVEIEAGIYLVLRKLMENTLYVKT